MATLEQVETALRNADRAGDVDAARALAQEYQRLRAEASAPKEGNDSPWYAKAGQAVDDIARIGANAVTLGFADKFASYMGGNNLEEERARTSEARDRAGSAAFATDILGMLMPGMAASKAVGTAIPALRGGSMVPSVGREAVAGGIVGTGTAVGNDQSVGENALLGVLGGAGGTVAGRAIGSAVDGVASRLGVAPGILSSTKTPRKDVVGMRADREAAYGAVERAGIGYSKSDANSFVRGLRSHLISEGLDKDLHPQATAFLKKMAKDIQGTRQVSVSTIDKWRRLASRDVKGKGGDNFMGQQIRSYIDDFIKHTQPNVGNATAKQADDLVKSAREANRKLEVRRTVEGAIERGKNAGTFAGELGAFRSILNQGAKGTRPKERELLEKIVRGADIDETIARNMRTANIGSFGTGAAAAGIGSGGNPAAALVGGVTAMAIPRVGASLSRRALNRNIEALLDELGGASFNPSLLRSATSNIPGGTIGGALALENADRRNKRKRRRSD